MKKILFYINAFVKKFLSRVKQKKVPSYIKGCNDVQSGGSIIAPNVRVLGEVAEPEAK